MSSQSVEEYLEAVYRFNEEGEPAKTKELAERLGVAPASVTEMIQKLAAEGFLEYEPYKGARLTARGMVDAQKIVRKHRLLERFLHDVLKLKPERVHDEACRLEHALSDDVANALCRALDQPDTCPDDNNPIPPCNLDVEDCGQCTKARLEESKNPRLVTQLSNLRVGDEADIAFVRGGKGVCERLLSVGITPGTHIRVVNAAPLRGPIEIEVRGSTIALGRSQAESVFVTIEDLGTCQHSSQPGPHSRQRRRGNRG